MFDIGILFSVSPMYQKILGIATRGGHLLDTWVPTWMPGFLIYRQHCKHHLQNGLHVQCLIIASVLDGQYTTQLPGSCQR